MLSVCQQNERSETDDDDDEDMSSAAAETAGSDRDSAASSADSDDDDDVEEMQSVTCPVILWKTCLYLGAYREISAPVLGRLQKLTKVPEILSRK